MTPDPTTPGTTSRDDELSELAADLYAARNLDPRVGREDFSRFPALIARADALGDDRMRFIARLEAAHAAYWTGQATDLLTLVVWMRRLYDRRGASLGLDEEQVSTFYITEMWVLDLMVRLPELSVGQILQMLEEWEQRVRGTAFDVPEIGLLVRADLAYHQGRPSEAEELLASCPVDPTLDELCEESHRGELAGRFARLGAFERAAALCEPDLAAGGTGCDLHPADSYAGLTRAWAAQGRTADVRTAARSLRSAYRSANPGWELSSAVVSLLRVGALDDAVDIALELLPRLGDCDTPFDVAQVSACVAASLYSLVDRDPDAMVRHRRTSAERAELSAARIVADDLAAHARQIAARFDERNGSRTVSALIEETLAIRVPTAEPRTAAVPIADRDAEGLLSGATAYAELSPRRAVECAGRLRSRLHELSGERLAAARMVVAADLSRTDPEGAVDEFDAIVAEFADVAPVVVAMARISGNVTKARLGRYDVAALAVVPSPDPVWAPIDRARWWSRAAWAAQFVDGEAAGAALHEGLAAVAESTDPAAALVEAGLHQQRAEILRAAGGDASVPLAAALTAGRAAVAAAADPDARLRATGLLATVLMENADAQVDEYEPARRLLDEAIAVARFECRGGALRARGDLAERIGDAETARDCYEQAAAVWTVEGNAYAADIATLDLANLRIDVDPHEVIGLARGVAARMGERADHEGEQRALVQVGRAESAVGDDESAARTLGLVLDRLHGDEAPDWVAWVHSLVGDAVATFDPHASLTSYDAAAAGFLATEHLRWAAECLRKAAVAALQVDELDAVHERVERAEVIYADRLDPDGEDSYDHALLALVAADRLVRLDLTAGLADLAAIGDRAKARGWRTLAASALSLAAETLLERSPDGTVDPRVRDLVAEGLALDPDHGACNRLHAWLPAD